TLENAGIEAVVFGEDLVTNLPHINAIKVELQVFEKDAEKAKQILAEKAEQGDENDESDQ
ncbi:MAG: putative signal transducing protein, partial [Planctomycetota bacterium]